MKRICTFTLDSEEYPSDKFDYYLRIIADILYTEIGAFDNALNVNKNIKLNKLCEGDKFHRYYFTSEMFDKANYNYEPFIIGDRTFAFTINDENIDEANIRIWLAYVLRLVGVSYNVVFDSFPYASSNKDDEGNRRKAIKEIYKKERDKITMNMGFGRKLVKPKTHLNKNRLSVMYRG